MKLLKVAFVKMDFSDSRSWPDLNEAAAARAKKDRRNVHGQRPGREPRNVRDATRFGVEPRGEWRFDKFRCIGSTTAEAVGD